MAGLPGLQALDADETLPAISAMLGEQAAKQKPGFGDFALALIPLLGAFFAGPLNQKVKEYENTRQLQNNLVQTLASQGIYDPTVYANILGDKKAAELYAKQGLLRAATRRSEQRQLLSDITTHVNKPAPDLPTSYSQAPEGLSIGQLSAGSGVPQRPPGFEVKNQRYGELLRNPDFLARLALLTGKDFGDVIKAAEEGRGQRVLSQVFPELAGTQPSAAPAGGPVAAPAPVRQQAAVQAPVQTLNGTITTGPNTATPKTPAERAEFQQLLQQTGGNRVIALELFNRKRQTEQEVSTLPPVTVTADRTVLPPFRVSSRLGARVGESGKVSLDPRDAQIRSSQDYINTAVATQPASVIPQALHNIYTGGGNLDPETYKLVATQATRGAFLQALQDPAIAAIRDPYQRFRAAVQRTQEILSPPGLNTGGALFDPTALKDLADPAVLERTLAREKGIGGAEAVVSPQAEAAAGAETTRAGTREAVTTGQRIVTTTQAQAGVIPPAPTPGAVTPAETTQDIRGTQQAAQEQALAVRRNSEAPFQFVEPKAGNYFDKQTGSQEVLAMQSAKDVYDRQGKGEVILLDDKDRDRVVALQQAAASIKPLFDLYQKIYGPDGYFHQLAPKQRAGKGLVGSLKRFAQTDPDLAAADKAAQAYASNVADAFRETGRKTDQDVTRMLGLLPDLGVLPDSAAVAQRKVNLVLGALDAQLGSLLRNPRYQESTYTTRPQFLLESDILR